MNETAVKISVKVCYRIVERRVYEVKADRHFPDDMGGSLGTQHIGNFESREQAEAVVSALVKQADKATDVRVEIGSGVVDAKTAEDLARRIMTKPAAGRTGL